jgi:hypothetical protein
MGHVEVTEVVMQVTFKTMTDKQAATHHVIGNVREQIDELQHIVVHIIEVVQSTETAEQIETVMHDMQLMMIMIVLVEHLANGYVIDNTDEIIFIAINTTVTVL